MTKTSAIGIDLGTTNSCVGVLVNGKVEIIANDWGNKMTPSYVAFTDTQTLVGDAAKNQMNTNLSNTVFDSKRMIGKRFYDSKHWPFTVVRNKGKHMIEVEFKGKTKQFSPEKISSMLLAKMKKIAESYLGKTVINAVMTVPTTFNNSQRQAIKYAGTISGLNVIRIINESTAAAIAYGLNKCSIGERNVLIFDLGGSYLDVSIVTINDAIFEVKSNAGNKHLGGEDFDKRIVDHFIEEFKRIYHKDLSVNKKSLRRLRTECERAKRMLSFTTQSSILIALIFEGIDFFSTITRTQFEILNEDLFRSTLEPIVKALSDANMEKSQIDDIVLVGGSTRIPMIQKLLQDFFNGKELKITDNPEEAVAYGAAVYAAILNGDKSESFREFLLLDVTQHSYHIETEGGAMTTIIKRNTTIPTRQRQTVLYNKHIIQVYEGDKQFFELNQMLGECKVKGMSSQSRDFHEIEVTFDIDADSILSVSAEVKSIGRKNMNNNNEILSINEIEIMIRELEIYSEDVKDRLQAMTSLHSYALSICSAIKDEKHNLLQFERNILLDELQDVIKWLFDNRLAEKYVTAHKQKDIEYICNPIFNKLNQSTGFDARVFRFRYR